VSAPSGKLHYSADDTGKTVCGRVIRGNLRVTSNPYKITCIPCKTSPRLDGVLGNMVHAGH
jgi:hypothetical protein